MLTRRNLFLAGLAAPFAAIPIKSQAALERPSKNECGEDCVPAIMGRPKCAHCGEGGFHYTATYDGNGSYYGLKRVCSWCSNEWD